MVLTQNLQLQCLHHGASILYPFIVVIDFPPLFRISVHETTLAASEDPTLTLGTKDAPEADCSRLPLIDTEASSHIRRSALASHASLSPIPNRHPSWLGMGMVKMDMSAFSTKPPGQTRTTHSQQ